MKQAIKLGKDIGKLAYLYTEADRTLFDEVLWEGE
jgi:hypothetical protein